MLQVLNLYDYQSLVYVVKNSDRGENQMVLERHVIPSPHNIARQHRIAKPCTAMSTV
jgi:hypothetical protein